MMWSFVILVTLVWSVWLVTVDNETQKECLCLGFKVTVFVTDGVI